MNIVEEIGAPAALEQTAEECMELAHACLKYARYLRKENPVAKTVKEANVVNNINEEVADIIVCANALIDGGIIDREGIDSWYNEKEKRWEKRIEAIKEENKNGN